MKPEEHENWNRYYNPVPGVYLSIEPYHRIPVFAEAQAHLGQTPPAYAYALNNPLQFIDPDGRDAINNSRFRCRVKPENADWRDLAPNGGRYYGNVDGVRCESGHRQAVFGPNWWPTAPQPDVIVDSWGVPSCKNFNIYEKAWPDEVKHTDWQDPGAPWLKGP